MGFISKLKDRWNLGSTARVIIVLIVFALTGTTVLILKRPVIAAIDPVPENKWIFTLIYLILVSFRAIMVTFLLISSFNQRTKHS